MKEADKTFRLPFDQYQRYRLAAEIAQVLEGDGGPLTVLEVGGYPPRLRDFLPGHEIKILDQAEAEAPDYVRGEATALPFPDRHFGLVISLDTLEHVKPEQRRRFIAELCRVAKGYVMMAAPFSSEAVKAADRAIFEFIRSHCGYEQTYLKEHIELELPDLVTTMTGMLDQGLDVQVIPSGRLDRWLFMMAAYYTLDADPDLREALPPLMEAYNRAFYEFDKAEPAYRHFLVGAYEGMGRRWGMLADLAAGESAETVEMRAVTMVMELGRVIALKRKDKEREALLARIQNQDAEIQALRDHVRALQEFERKVKSLPLYSFYEKFLKPRTRP